MDIKDLPLNTEDNIMSPEIKKEIKRLKSLPQKGHYTCLHHNKDMIEKSYGLMERVNYILSNKPKDEILIRLKNIHYLSPERYKEFEVLDQSAWNKYFAIQQSAWKKYNTLDQVYLKIYRAIQQPALDEYKKTLCDWLKSWVPFTSWNGRSIFVGSHAST